MTGCGGLTMVVAGWSATMGVIWVAGCNVIIGTELVDPPPSGVFVWPWSGVFPPLAMPLPVCEPWFALAWCPWHCHEWECWQFAAANAMEGCINKMATRPVISFIVISLEVVNALHPGAVVFARTVGRFAAVRVLGFIATDLVTEQAAQHESFIPGLGKTETR